MAAMAAVFVVRQRLQRLLARGVKACQRHSGNSHDTISREIRVALIIKDERSWLMKAYRIIR
jgi:hypothetical protein